MATNTTQNNPSSSGAATSDPSVTPSKSGKAKATRSPRRSAGAASKRSPSPRGGASSAEILFEDLPNPYHTPQPPYIWIDHPQEQTRFTGPVYVVRLGVGGAEHVEISIDGGVWQHGRFTSGYWWYDWSAIQPGRHTLTARMKTFDGRWFRTPVRSCERRP